jgi:small acid-soluble spore protein F (minor alpha/beta-type SASP)
MKLKNKEVIDNLVSKKSKKIKVKTEKELALEKLKFEVAKEIGVFDKVKMGGWSSLTAQETGRIGGIMNSRRKKNQR